MNRIIKAYFSTGLSSRVPETREPEIFHIEGSEGSKGSKLGIIILFILFIVWIALLVFAGYLHFQDKSLPCNLAAVLGSVTTFIFTKTGIYYK